MDQIIYNTKVTSTREHNDRYNWHVNKSGHNEWLLMSARGDLHQMQNIYANMKKNDIHYIDYNGNNAWLIAAATGQLCVMQWLYQETKINRNEYLTCGISGSEWEYFYISLHLFCT